LCNPLFLSHGKHAQCTNSELTAGKIDNETHISTQQPKAEEQARLPRTDEIQGWTQSAIAPARQRKTQAYRQRRVSRARDGTAIPVRQTLRRAEILRGKEEFNRVFSSGRKINGKIIKSSVLMESGSGAQNSPLVRAGFAVPKDLKRAVDRNRVKRLMRESYRRNKEMVVNRCAELSTKMEIVFLYLHPARAVKRLPTYSEVETDIKLVLSRVI
jgi:ribonuclease P protein component